VEGKEAGKVQMTRLYKLSNDAPVPIAAGRLANENMIQNWIAQHPQLLGLDLLIIGREVVAPDRGRVDLLGIDEDGNLAILELKRDRTPREVIAQTLDYASWIVTLKTREVHDIAFKHLKRDLELAFRERFDTALPETLNESHSMVIIASKFDASSQRIVRYLSETYDLAINTAFFTVFDDDGKTLPATDWLLDESEVAERSVAKVKGPWSGLWYVNVSEGPHRSWKDMQDYGFVAAGGGEKYSGPLNRLHPGDRIVAYQKGAGYVGYGIVTTASVIARDFQTKGGPLLDQPLAQPGMARPGEDATRAEYVVGVNWIKSVPIPQAKRFDGMFANQNVVCKLRDPKTIEFLRDQFGVSME
jgi:Endonuclease NucS